MPELTPESQPPERPGVTDDSTLETNAYRPPPAGDLELWLGPMLGIPDAQILDLDGLRVPLLGQRDKDLSEEIELSNLLEEIELSTARVIGRAGKHPPITRPSRYPRLAVEAAYLARIEGSSFLAVRDYLKLADTPEVVSRRPSGDRERSRSVERVIRKGDELWRRLGGWPWAAFEAPLPNGWRCEPDAAESLIHWHAKARARGRAADSLHKRRLRDGAIGPFTGRDAGASPTYVASASFARCSAASMPS